MNFNLGTTASVIESTGTFLQPGIHKAKFNGITRDVITGKEIKALLKKAYENLGFNKKVSIEDFRNYMQIEEKYKRVDGKITRGYVIVRKLTKFIK